MTTAAAQSLDRSTLEAHQLSRLQALVTILSAHNPFYAVKLRHAGIDTAIASLNDFVTSVPFTFKSEIVQDQAQHPPYGSNLTYPLNRYTRCHQTSGTTGKPMRWLDTKESWEWMVDCWTRVYQAADATPNDRVFFPFSFGPFLGFWIAFDTAARLGCLALSGGGMRSAARIRAILENQITILCSTPSYAIHLAEIAREENIDLRSGSVRAIIVAGEPGGCVPATRDLIETLWPGARVVDHHGMTEIGPVTYECPVRRGSLHVIETEFFTEIIHPETHAPIGVGEVGELVLTNLGRVGSPLLRYRTGDLVRRGGTERCACGSHELALEGGILARSDGMTIIRGVNVYPSTIEDILRSCGIVEYRVETFTSGAMSEMRVEVEAESEEEAHTDVVSRVSTAIHHALGLRVQIARVPLGTLPRFEGKAKRWVLRSKA